MSTRTPRCVWIVDVEDVDEIRIRLGVYSAKTRAIAAARAEAKNEGATINWDVPTIENRLTATTNFGSRIWISRENVK